MTNERADRLCTAFYEHPKDFHAWMFFALLVATNFIIMVTA